MMNDPENNESLKDALKAYGLKHDINRIHQQMMPQLKHGNKNAAPVRSLFTYAGKIAAGFLILIIATAILVYFNATPENLFNSKFSPYEESVQRGSETKPSSVKEKFMQAQTYLRTGDTEMAILTFAEILNSNSLTPEKILNDDAEYYLALAYLKSDQPQNALPVLEKINSDHRHLYNDQVSVWYLLKVKIAAWKNK